VQWFKFTATAATQYIHAGFGTLTSLYVQVYDSSVTAVGTETNLTGSTKYISRTTTADQEYYIRVRPYSSSGSGTYKIAFNTTIIPPGTTLLTADTWADGNIPTSTDVQWFKFTATAATQYIHAGFGTLTSLYVQVYDSTVTTVGTETNLSGSTGSTRNISQSLTENQVYYIRVRPYSSSYSGTYKIAFNTTIIPPGTTPLTADTWADGNIPTSADVQWFKFTATAATQYIHAGFLLGTLSSLYVQVYDSNVATVGSEINLNNTTKYTSQSLTEDQVYYIKVRPYSSSGSGTYQIAFSASSTAPATTIPGAIQLTANTWANGNIPTSTGVQWFKFTATAATQYIHVSFGTLTDLHVQVYDSSGTTVGTETNLYSSTKSINRTTTADQEYYIRVRPYGTNSGAYQVAFNTSTTAPN